jgi:hypothetical protein
MLRKIVSNFTSRRALDLLAVVDREKAAPRFSLSKKLLFSSWVGSCSSVGMFMDSVELYSKFLAARAVSRFKKP